MTKPSASVFCLLVGACSVPAPPASAPAAPQGTALAPAEAATPAVPAAEQCGDGRDNDQDGLLDCEDADCQPECDLDFVPVPVASSGALTIRSRVTGGGALRLSSQTFQRSSRAFYSSIRSSNAVVRTWTAEASVLSGTASVSSSAATTPCSWWATGVRFGRRVSQRSGTVVSASFATAADSVVPLTAASSGVDSGCPVPASALLAPGLADSARWHFGATSAGALVGRRWLAARLPLFPETVSSSTRRNTVFDYDRYEEQEGAFLFVGSVAGGETATWQH